MRSQMLVAGAVLVSIVTFPASAWAAATFAPAVTFASGDQPRSVAIGDLDGDGTPDLAVAHAGDDNLRVFLGDGDGTFSAGTTNPAGTQPMSVAIADLNADGDPDLVAANTISQDVSVLLGNGDGTFAAPVQYPTSLATIFVTTGDLDGDGDLDLVVGNFGDEISVLLGNGDGTFDAAVGYAVGLDPISVAIADLDDDGVPDLATANRLSDNVSILLGNGDGTFAAAVHYAAGDGPASVAIRDLNGDGKLDLATADLTVGSASILLGNGDGTFGPASHYATQIGSSSIAVGDVDDDGKLDLVTANFDSTTVSVLLGIGDGTFANAVHHPVGQEPFSVAMGDLNGDARLDLATANWGSDNVSVLLNLQGFITGPTASISGTPRQGEMLTADEGLPNPVPDSFTYEWFADGVTIGGATAKTFELTSAQVGQKISVKVTAKKLGLADASHTSDQTVPVVGIFTPGPTATITGTARQGQTLTADEGSPNPLPGSFTYEWFADGVTIGGATAKTFELTSAQVGQKISVKVTAKKDSFLDASDVSDETSPVVGIFSPGPKATISGYARIGSVLIARPGSPSPAPTSVVYRWYANGKAIPGATARYLKLTSAHHYKRIQVKAWAVKAGYLTASSLSAPTSPVNNAQAKVLSMELNDYTVWRRQRVYAEIERLAPGEPFSIVLDGTKLASGKANTRGVAVVGLTIPSTAKTGARIIRAYGMYPDRTDPDRITIR